MNKITFNKKHDNGNLYGHDEENGIRAYPDRNGPQPLFHETWTILRMHSHTPKSGRPVQYAVLDKNITIYHTVQGFVGERTINGASGEYPASLGFVHQKWPEFSLNRAFLVEPPQKQILSSEWEAQVWGPSFEPQAKLVRCIRTKEQLRQAKEDAEGALYGAPYQEKKTLIEQLLESYAKQYGVATTDMHGGWNHMKYMVVPIHALAQRIEQDARKAQERLHTAAPVLWGYTSLHTQVWRAGGKEANVIPGTTIEIIRQFFRAEGIAEEPRQGMYERAEPFNYGLTLDE